MEVKRHINPKACGRGGWKQKVVGHEVMINCGLMLFSFWCNQTILIAQ